MCEMHKYTTHCLRCAAPAAAIHTSAVPELCGNVWLVRGHRARRPRKDTSAASQVPRKRNAHESASPAPTGMVTAESGRNGSHLGLCAGLRSHLAMTCQCTPTGNPAMLESPPVCLSPHHPLQQCAPLPPSRPPPRTPPRGGAFDPRSVSCYWSSSRRVSRKPARSVRSIPEASMAAMPTGPSWHVSTCANMTSGK